MLVAANVNLAKADDAPQSSAPSCKFGEPENTEELTSEVLAASDARFMKLCIESRGALVNGDDTRLVHNLTQPGRSVGPSPRTILPTVLLHAIARKLRIYLSYVVETDGQVSSAAILQSCGFQDVDAAAVRWANSMKRESPAYLDFTRVRMYSVMRLDLDTRLDAR